MTYNIADYQVRQEVLDWIKFGARASFPIGMIDVRVGVQHDIFETMFATVSARVLCKHLPKVNAVHTEPVFFRYPDGTWQTFKSRHAGSWWLRGLVRRRPVRMTEARQLHTFTVMWEPAALYPWQTLIPEGAGLGRPVLYVADTPEWIRGRYER